MIKVYFSLSLYCSSIYRSVFLHEHFVQSAAMFLAGPLHEAQEAAITIALTFSSANQILPYDY